MANIKRKQTREERLEKKRQAEKLRYQRLQNDPVKNAEMKEKERQKYLKKKEKGQIKGVKDMTLREKRVIRKIWREKTRKRRDRLRLLRPEITPDTPPSSDNEEPPPPERVENRRAAAAKKRALNQRKSRNKQIRKQNKEIKRLKEKIKTFQKKMQRLNKKQLVMTPNSKVSALLIRDTVFNTEEVKRKLLFSEVMENQLEENLSRITDDKEKQIFRRVLSGRIAKKYKVLNQINVKPIKHSSDKNKSLLDMSRKTRKDKKSTKLKGVVIRFLEEDCNSRLCPGKRDFITKNKERKQKRFLSDTMKNLYWKFVRTKGIICSYTMFCRLRPFWIMPPRIDKRETCLCIIHANMDLTLFCLSQAKILPCANHQSLLEHLCCDRYSELCLSRECQRCRIRSMQYKEFDNAILLKHHKWQSVVEEIEDFKTKKVRNVRKYAKRTLASAPRDVVLQLENDLQLFLKHEMNISHQYQVIKVLKENLTEKDCVIHMDFSENYNTKYSEEVQSFHFGGSRTQISLHTVVVYTKEKTECFATMSINLSHNVPAIWAHLEPILQKLPNTIENIHFLSDGPVTQYRNKDMFFYLACQLTTANSNICNFTWNYHEAGHGKGAPDGVGGTCKRTADRLVATGTDIPTIDVFAKAIEENCPGVKTFVITDSEIQSKKTIIETQQSQIKSFVGTLKVHQVRGSVFLPLKLSMKSLSCFCSIDFCPHYDLGQIVYPRYEEQKLNITDVYSDSDTERPSCSRQALNQNHTETFKNGDYVLVKFQQRKKEYRYVGVCSEVDEDEGEVLITFLKTCNDNAILFKVDEQDVSHVPFEQICKKLPEPSLVLQGDRVFYKFEEPVDIFEQ